MEGRFVNFLSAWLLLFGIPMLPAVENPGIKMTIEYGQPGSASQRTIYFQADRKRFAYQNSFGQQQVDGSVRPIYGPRLVSITRCDLGQSLELNLDTTNTRRTRILRSRSRKKKWRSAECGAP